jgi:ArsR family transcriptional regulator
MNRSTILERSASERARRFAALGDPARLAILEHLRRDTRCLCEMQDDLGMAPNLLSYHMRILREAGLVSGRRNGRRIDYRIEPQGFEALCTELVAIGGAGER